MTDDPDAPAGPFIINHTGNRFQMASKLIDQTAPVIRGSPVWMAYQFDGDKLIPIRLKRNRWPLWFWAEYDNYRQILNVCQRGGCRRGFI